MNQPDVLRPQAILASLFVLLIAGCAAEKSLWGDPESGLILQYRMPEDRRLRYELSSETAQHMEMMGQPMVINIQEIRIISVQARGMTDENLRLGITLDSMNMKIKGPGGDLSPDVTGVLGKSFGMTLSPGGREMELSGVDTIQYDLGPQGKQSVGPAFQTLFPDMSLKPAKIGETWSGKDTILQKSGDGELRITIHSVNTLSALKRVEEMECAVITSVLSGTVEGKGKQRGMDLVTEGTIEGTDTSYFAYTKGIYVGGKTITRSDVMVTGSGPREIRIPMRREMTIQTKLLAPTGTL
jgi:hypothetical protein